MQKKLAKNLILLMLQGIFHLEVTLCNKGNKVNLNDKGIFIIQFLYMSQIMKNVAFDQIYHEHLLYYNLETLQNLLNMHNLNIRCLFI